MSLILEQLMQVEIKDPRSVVTMEIYNPVVEKKNPIVIYHHGCADGFGAAWCFWSMQNILGDIEFHPGIYQNSPPDVTGRVVFLVDFSYKRAVVEDMLTSAKHIYLIDHHKTALEDLAGLEYKVANFTAYTDLNRSGAILAWDFLHNSLWTGENLAFGLTLVKEYKEDTELSLYSTPPAMLRAIEDYDLWRFKLDHTREIRANLMSYPMEFSVWNEFMTYDRRQMGKFADAGEAIERKHHKDVRNLVDVCRRYHSIGGHTVPVASLPHFYASDAGNLMATEWEEGKSFAASYYDTADHRIFSLRSCPSGVDVSDVAKLYGGGGHRNAAGFRVDRSHALASF